MWRLLQVFTVITTNDVCRVFLMLFHCTMHLRSQLSQHSVVPSRRTLHTIYKASQMPCSVLLEKVVCTPSSTTRLIQTQRNQGTLVRPGTDECHSGLHQIILWSLLSMLAVIYQVGKLPWLLPCRPTLLFVCQLTIVLLLQLANWLHSIQFSQNLLLLVKRCTEMELTHTCSVRNTVCNWLTAWTVQ